MWFHFFRICYIDPVVIKKSVLCVCLYNTGHPETANHSISKYTNYRELGSYGYGNEWSISRTQH